MLIKALQLIPNIAEDSKIVSLIKTTVDDLVNRLSPQGNLTYTLDEDTSQKKEEDYPVHFCHGSPGAIPLFIEAHKLF